MQPHAHHAHAPAHADANLATKLARGPIQAAMHDAIPPEGLSLTPARALPHGPVMRMFGILTVLLSVACSKPNPVVCCSSPADCASLGASDQTRPCADGFVCIDHECGLAPPADAAPACGSDSDCPASAPHCTSNQTCAQCVTSDQCAASAPVCDTTSNSCRPCGADSECASAVCDATNGTCLDATTVLYAAPGGPDTGTCTQNTPCSISHAVASVSAARGVIKMLPGMYTANVVVSGTTVWIDGVGSTLAVGASASGIEIVDGAHVRITGLNVLNLQQDVDAIACKTVSSTATPSVDLDGVSIDSAGRALAALPCTVSATRSTFHVRNTDIAAIYAFPGSNGTTVANIDRCVFDGGVAVLGYGSSTVSVSNSLLMNMLSADGAMRGTALLSTPPGRVFGSFLTLVNARLACGDGQPACRGGTAAGVCIENSIISGPGPDSVSGTACAVDYSLAFPQTAPLTGSHDKANVDPQFADASNGNYALRATSPAIDAANPSATATTDLVGTTRPQGAHDDMGAYEYKP